MTTTLATDKNSSKKKHCWVNTLAASTINYIIFKNEEKNFPKKIKTNYVIFRNVEIFFKFFSKNSKIFLKNKC